ncbi:MAG: TetR/AcrR family transcriptional regulator [Gemmatimonadaceae bacterium]|nr:TetR/AcrR family transcriptional regulator [Gemmatimonadaceae bacterium]
MARSGSNAARNGSNAALADLETRERILAAAHRVFLAQGTAKARTADIAREAGVNKALLHYYFSTKATLADAVFAQAIADFMPRLFSLLGDPAISLHDKIHALVQEQTDFHSARPYLAGYVVSEMYTEPDRLPTLMTARGRPPLEALRQQLDAEAAAGRMRPISVEVFVVNLMALLVFPFMARPMLTAMLRLDDRRFPAFVEERRRLLPSLILASLRP